MIKKDSLTSKDRFSTALFANVLSKIPKSATTAVICFVLHASMIGSKEISKNLSI